MRRVAAIVIASPLLVALVILGVRPPARKETKSSPPLGVAAKISRPTLVIKASIAGGPWKTASAIYPLKGQKVLLKVNRATGGAARWYQIVPDISKIYKNANFPWDPNPYKWIGLARIDYSRRELTAFRGKWEIEPLPELARTASNSPQYCRDVGSFWFQVEVEERGKIKRSPGIEDSDKKGLSPSVFRVSVRDGKGYLGYLTTFFNVPGVFGSIPAQSHNYIGVDCCDALVAAYGIWTGKRIKKDYSVAMLVNKLPKVAQCDIVSGKPSRRLKWGREIRPGYFIAVRAPSGRQYWHIGALCSDADHDGVLSEKDIVLHAGPTPLHYSSLSEGGFDGHIVVLEPKLSHLPR
jgi:hypothetical protein